MVDDNFLSDENDGKFYKRENTLGKGEIYEQFLLSLQRFQKTCTADNEKKQSLFWKKVKFADPEDRIFNRFISDISVVLREIIVTFSDSIETDSPVKTEIIRVVSLSTTEITEITRFKKKNLQGKDTLKYFVCQKIIPHRDSVKYWAKWIFLILEL